MTPKISNRLLLDKIELDRLIRALDQDGYRLLLLQQAETFGLLISQRAISDQAPNDFLNFKVSTGSNPGTIRISQGLAIDNQGQFVRFDGQDLIPIPADGDWYYVRVQYEAHPYEMGTVNLGGNGSLAGHGTQFLNTIRGGSTYPSRIKFYRRELTQTVVGSITEINPRNYTPSVLNPLDYEVAEVSGDNTAVLAGDFVSENNLFYSVFGTFAPNYVPLPSESEIFPADACRVVVRNEGSFIPSEQFVVARVRNTGALLEVEDLRADYFSTADGFDLRNLTGGDSHLFGVRSTQWDVASGPQDENVVEVGWGFRAQAGQWTIEPATRTVVLTAGYGGRYESTADFVTGVFNGWRLYVANNPDNSFGGGSFYRVLESVKSGNQIRLRLDTLRPSDFPQATANLVVVPDASAISIRCIRTDGQGFRHTFDFDFSIYSGWGHGRIKLPVSTPNQSLYTLYYALRTHKTVTPWYNPMVGAIGGHPTRYLNEQAWEDNGVQKLPVLPVYYQNVSLPGHIVLTESPASFRNFRNLVVSGDLFGTGAFILTQLLANSPDPVLFQLLPGATPSYYRFLLGENVTLTKTLVIALRNNSITRDGNFFTLDIQWPTSNVDFGAFDIEIRENYVDLSNPGDLRFSLKRYWQLLVSSDIARNDGPRLGLQIFFRRLGTGTWAIRWMTEPDWLLKQLTDLGDGFVTSTQLNTVANALGVRVDRSTYLGKVTGVNGFKVAWNYGPGQAWIAPDAGIIADSPDVLLGQIPTDIGHWLVINTGSPNRLADDINLSQPGTAIPNVNGFDGFGYQIALPHNSILNTIYLRWVRPYTTSPNPNGQDNTTGSGFGPWIRIARYDELVLAVQNEANARAVSIQNEINARTSADNALATSIQTVVNELNATQDGAGLNADGTFSPVPGSRNLTQERFSAAGFAATIRNALRLLDNSFVGNPFQFGNVGITTPISELTFEVGSVDVGSNFFTVAAVFGRGLRIGNTLHIAGQIFYRVETSFNANMNQLITSNISFNTLFPTESTLFSNPCVINVSLSSSAVASDVAYLACLGQISLVSGLRISFSGTMPRNIIMVPGSTVIFHFETMLILN